MEVKFTRMWPLNTIIIPVLVGERVIIKKNADILKLQEIHL